MTLWIGASLLIVLGIGWATFFTTQAAWAIVAMDLGMLAVGITIAVLTHFKRTRMAFFLLVISMFIVISGVCLLLDVPSAQAPRSTHNFLLVLAIAALVFLRDDTPAMRYGVTGVCCLGFVVLASWPVGLDTGYSLPDGMRVWGTWVNNFFSALGIYALVHVMVSDLAEHSAMEMALRKGLVRGEFFLTYQPQVNAEGHVMGAEALLRWRHPKLGLVPPNEFIPLAEQTGLILPLGAWVLGTACTQLVEWSGKPGLDKLTLAVNVSVRQFQQPNFVQQVQSVIERTGAQPRRLKLELTESSLVHDIEDIITEMTQLKALGVGFSLDDFGTGYSSLSYLHRLPIAELKLDMAFVRDLTTSPTARALTVSVLSIAHSLEMVVVAEGVETPGQQQWLQAHGCPVMQGYLFGRPMPANEIEAWLDAAGHSGR